MYPSSLRLPYSFDPPFSLSLSLSLSLSVPSSLSLARFLSLSLTLSRSVSHPHLAHNLFRCMCVCVLCVCVFVRVCVQQGSGRRLQVSEPRAKHHTLTGMTRRPRSYCAAVSMPTALVNSAKFASAMACRELKGLRSQGLFF